jgi:hypothetical protein
MKPFTVKVPAAWPRIDSERAQVHLRDFFIHPLCLPADPGAGERAIGLTLNERLVSKLAEGTGDKPAVAIRRLLAAHIRELPTATQNAIVTVKTQPAKPRDRRKAITPLHLGKSQPAWALSRLDPYARQMLAQMKLPPDDRPSRFDLVAVGSSRVKSSSVSDFFDAPLIKLLLFALVFFGLFLLLAYQGGAQSKSSGAKSESKYPAWRPR